MSNRTLFALLPAALLAVTLAAGQAHANGKEIVIPVGQSTAADTTVEQAMIAGTDVDADGHVVHSLGD